MGHLNESIIEWSAAARPLPGEAESGDAYLLRFTPDGVVLAVVDGLGHGAEAARAARAALATVEDHLNEPPAVIAARCHDALRGSRGAVMSLAAIDTRRDSLTWLGIGNVAGFLLRSHPGAASSLDPLLLRSGVLGCQTASLSHTVFKLQPGDTLFIVTDGVRWDPAEHAPPGEPPRAMAERLLRECAVEGDDALALVVRYHGAPPAQHGVG